MSGKDNSRARQAMRKAREARAEREKVPTAREASVAEALAVIGQVDKIRVTAQARDAAAEIRASEESPVKDPGRDFRSGRATRGGCGGQGGW